MRPRRALPATQLPSVPTRALRGDFRCEALSWSTMVDVSSSRISPVTSTVILRDSHRVPPRLHAAMLRTVSRLPAIAFKVRQILPYATPEPQAWPPSLLRATSRATRVTSAPIRK